MIRKEKKKEIKKSGAYCSSSKSNGLKTSFYFIYLSLFLIFDVTAWWLQCRRESFANWIWKMLLKLYLDSAIFFFLLLCFFYDLLDTEIFPIFKSFSLWWLWLDYIVPIQCSEILGIWKGLSLFPEENREFLLLQIDCDRWKPIGGGLGLFVKLRTFVLLLISLWP